MSAPKDWREMIHEELHAAGRSGAGPVPLVDDPGVFDVDVPCTDPVIGAVGLPVDGADRR